MYAINHILTRELIEDEGFSLESYPDHKGNWTIGIGHLLGRNPEYEYYRWTPADVFSTFVQDTNTAIYYVEKQIYNFNTLSDNRKRVLISMMFNMGPGSFSGFVKMIPAILENDHQRVYAEMLDSKWARIDVPNRANRLATRWLVG